MIITIISIIGAILYLGAFALSEFKKSKPSLVLWLSAVAVSAFLVGRNWVVNGYVPFVSMYQVLTFLCLTFFPIYLLMRFLSGGGWMAKYFQLAAGVVLTGVCFMQGGDEWRFPPALQSVYFVPHILAYMIGYSLCAVAFIVMIVSFFKKGGDTAEDEQETETPKNTDKFGRKRGNAAIKAEEQKKTRKTSEREIFRLGCNSLARTAFPFMTAGMFLGALWANEVWGNFWSWDAKENWALVTWLLMALYLHFFKEKKLRRYTPLLIILTFAAVIVTMLFVNVFGGSSQHAYSM